MPDTILGAGNNAKPCVLCIVSSWRETVQFELALCYMNKSRILTMIANQMRSDFCPSVLLCINSLDP